MANKSITIPYENSLGQAHRLTVTFSLQSTINNGLPTESVGNIKKNASQVYYTQNRMVSAQDYNVFPFSKSSNIQKLKAVNKTHAGHSRYIDINDPTGTVQNIDLYGDDGYLYKEYNTSSSTTTISPNNTANNFVETAIPKLLSHWKPTSNHLVSLDLKGSPILYELDVGVVNAPVSSLYQESFKLSTLGLLLYHLNLSVLPGLLFSVVTLILSILDLLLVSTTLTLLIL